MSAIRTVRDMLASGNCREDLDAIVMPRASYDAIVAALTAYRDRRVLRVGVTK